MAGATGDHAQGNSGNFELLFVCIGNICRSPMAENLLRDRLARLGNAVQISSAGLAARPGRAMEPHAGRFLRERGVNVPQEFVSRPLTPALVERADLVLTADSGQVSQVAALVRGAWGRTFSLREFARLIATAPTPLVPASADDARALVAYANARRVQVERSRPGQDDVPDPIGRRYSAFRKTGGLIEECIETIASRLLPPGA